MNKILTLIVGMLLLGCVDDGISVPPNISIQELLATSDTISVDQKSIFLSTYLWRDFQPMSPADGKPLIALVFVTADDTLPFPPTISADAIWIVYKGEVWKSWFTNESTLDPLQKPNRFVKIARDGPKWGPDVQVDVIVRVNNKKGASQLLRASNQFIGRTD